MRFQEIAPIAAESTTSCVACVMSPCSMVLATRVAKNAPIKFSVAAMMTAVRQLRTPVETTVAMAFEAS